MSLVIGSCLAMLWLYDIMHLLSLVYGIMEHKQNIQSKENLGFTKQQFCC